MARSAPGEHPLELARACMACLVLSCVLNLLLLPSTSLSLLGFRLAWVALTMIASGPWALFYTWIWRLPLRILILIPRFYYYILSGRLAPFGAATAIGVKPAAKKQRRRRRSKEEKEKKRNSEPAMHRRHSDRWALLGGATIQSCPNGRQ